MFRHIIFAVALLAVSMPMILAGQLSVNNGCPYTIYCSGALGLGGFTGIIPVGPGGTYTSSLPVEDNGPGATLKCAKTSEPSSAPYQLEMSVKLGRSWLDLSHVDGSPFVAEHRRASWAGSPCGADKIIDCPPSSEDCDWPYMIDCQTYADAWMHLC